MKCDARRVGVQTNCACELNSGLRIGWTRQFDFAVLSFRNFSKCIWPVIQHVRVSGPMLFIVVAFRQEPQFVAAVIEPLAGTWWKILASQLGIVEQIGVPREGDLHQATAILRHDNQLHPSVRKLLRLPSLVVHGLDPAIRTRLRIRLAEC